MITLVGLIPERQVNPVKTSAANAPIMSVKAGYRAGGCVVTIAIALDEAQPQAPHS